MNEQILWFVKSVGVSALLIILAMNFVGYFYLNYSKKKLRLVELAYGLNNKWARGARISFFDVGFLFAQIPGVALGMKTVVKMGKPVRQFVLCPCLHFNQNYNKVWEECRGYCIGVTITFIIGLIAMACGGIAVAHDKGWF